jgi:uncharacterized membrane protein
MLCFGGALGLVAQIYNLSAHYPWAVLLWWVLDVPLIFWLRSRAAQAVVSGLFVLWAFLHANTWYEDREQLTQFWRYDLHCNFFLVGGLAACFAALAALSSSLRAGFYTGLWRVLGLCGAFGAAYLVSFRELAESSPAFGPQLVALTPALFALAVALLVLLAALVRGQAGALRSEGLAVLALVGLLALVCLLADEALPLAGNLLTLAGLLALAWHGTRERSAAQVNLALGFFALLIVTRYVEYLWDKLQGAYAFLGCGALLLVLGWFLEHRRRALMLRVRGGAT